MSIESFLYDHPVFRHEEFAAWRNNQQQIERRSLNMVGNTI